MKNIFKSRIFAFILGAVIFSGITGVAAYSMFAKDIKYTPSDNSWKKANGEDITNVEEAIDELYNQNSSNNWELISDATVKNVGYIYSNSLHLYKCGNVCKISFAMEGASLNTNYLFITDSKYYPKTDTGGTGMGMSNGFSQFKLKADGNFVVTSQSKKTPGWVSGDLSYICNNN